MSNPRQEYYIKNRETIIEKELARYHANIDEMHEKRKETTTCACGITLRKDCLSKHRKSKKHLNYINSTN